MLTLFPKVCGDITDLSIRKGLAKMNDKINFNPKDLTILVIDSHDFIRKSVFRVLIKLGFESIIDIFSAKDAKIAINTQDISLVICDLYMPGASGFELLDLVRNRETNSDTPFLVISGEADKDDIIKAIDKGADDYMLKPFQPEDLEKKIITILNRYHSPGPLLAKLRAAEQKIFKGKLDEAKQLVAEVVKAKPESARALHLLGVIEAKLNNRESAVKVFRKNIATHPNYLKNYASVADIFLQEKDHKKAIQALKQELELNPKQIRRQILLANMLLKDGNYPGAIEHYRLALLEDNKNPEALYGMGNAFAMASNLEKAIYYFKRMRRHHPQSSKSLQAIVRYAERAQSPRLAEMALRDEKKNHPERLDTYHLLCEFYLQHEKEEPSIDTLWEAIQKNPDNPKAYDLASRFFLQRDDYKSVSQVYQTYYQATKNPNVFLQQAELFLRAQKFSLAIATLHNGMLPNVDLPKVFKLLFAATVTTKQYGKCAFIIKKLESIVDEPQSLTENRKKISALLGQRRKKTRTKQAS